MSKTLISSASVRKLTDVSYANLFWLLLDYLTVFLVSGIAIASLFVSEKWGLHWGWVVPVWGAAMVLNGCLAHRIALMGHEASHYLLVPDRKWNDILAQLFCFFPIYATIDQYRWKHWEHHHHPNDPERDPNWGNGKAKAHFERFPMPRGKFFLHYYLKFFWPPFVIANLYDLAFISLRNFGAKGSRDREEKRRPVMSAMGVVYFLFLMVGHRVCEVKPWNPLIVFGCLYVIGLVVWAAIPTSSFRGSVRLAIPVKFSAWMRLTYYTGLFLSFSIVTRVTEIEAMRYYLLLWVAPLVYVFPYLMLLREVYQHANAGTGFLDNSRIIHADLFTRWAVLGYGNDFHLIHHIYPNIPQYRLRETHAKLLAESEDYRAAVKETYGIASASRTGNSSLIEDLGA